MGDRRGEIGEGEGDGRWEMEAGRWERGDERVLVN